MRLVMGALLGLILGLAACDGASEADTGKDRRSQASVPQPAPVGKIDRSHAGSAAPAAAFIDRQDKPHRITSFKGKTVLVNLWATWCAPCKAEMPALDRLAAREADRLVVLAISQDMEGWRAVDKFFTVDRFKALRPYLDQPNELALAYKAAGLPLSIAYGPDGRELWRVNGPLEWDKPETAALLSLRAETKAETAARGDPWRQAAARGIDFRAVGNEPGWYMEIDAGKRLTLVADYGKRRVETAAPAQIGTGATAFSTAGGGHALALSIAPGRCSDGMSDTVYPWRVEVKLDGRTYRGCGRRLVD